MDHPVEATVNFSHPQVQAFFDAFGRLRQRVIMRLMSTPRGIAVPPNVLVESAVPQQGPHSIEKVLA